MNEAHTALPLVVLISGSGTNLQAIIDAARDGSLPVDIRAVISNRPEAAGLDRANAAGISTEIVDHRQFDGREAFDQALAERIDAHDPALVVLAGFMRILTPNFVRHYQGRMLNIHPSLLPQFPGLNTHARALEAGAECHGASVHFVTDELDGGPLVLQVEVPVHAGDTAETLAARVLEQEHRLYPLAIRWFAEGRLQLQDGTAMLDGKPLTAPCRLDADTGAVQRCP
jgi:phosphoribosylglycinamide formyltransferase-1